MQTIEQITYIIGHNSSKQINYILTSYRAYNQPEPM